MGLSLLPMGRQWIAAVMRQWPRCALAALAAALTCDLAHGQATAETPPAQAPSSAVDNRVESPQPTAFETKYAYFLPVQFSELDGWRRDDPSQAWNALRETCRVLSTRSAWSGTCARARLVDGRGSDSVRQFFEQEFFVYQIFDRNRSPAGVITGYYEPLLSGSRIADPRYRFPVYGVPADLLLLDARSLPVNPGKPVFARRDGHRVIPLSGGGDQTVSADVYRVEIGDLRPDVRDKQLRVRIDGQSVVPYFTRAQIDAGAMTRAPVLAWVEDPAALYSMQMQGAGRVRLPDGGIIRVAFAEQNGHPFRPPVQSSNSDQRSSRSRPLVRGFAMPAVASDEGGIENTELAASTPALPQAGTSQTAKAGEEEMSPEVARMVDLLLGNTVDNPQGTAAPQGSPKNPGKQASATQRPGNARATAAEVAPVEDGRRAFADDPSYVFFRQIPNDDQGPIGALGVPLAPQRSVAVDPRTTPLGYPVFVSTYTSGAAFSVNRLMLAQDTGGAIRGAVRADYFWGFGPGAAESASHMKQLGRMWLLVPRAQPLASVSTRGLQSPQAEHDCVVPDPEFCVE